MRSAAAFMVCAGAALSPAVARAEEVPASLEATGSTIHGHGNPAVAPLPNGDVLVAGGYDYAAVPDYQGHGVKLAEVYDPTTGTFSETGEMATRREGAAAAPLGNGEVLVAGGRTAGETFTSVKTAEIYDPATGTFRATGPMAVVRAGLFAAPLPDGDVLVGGGYEEVFKTSTGYLASTEIYDPTTEEFSPGPELLTARYRAGAAQLRDGTILIAGGRSTTGFPSSSEILDPETDEVTPGAELEAPGWLDAAALSSGRVLFFEPGQFSEEEGLLQEYHPISETFSKTIVAASHAGASLAPLPEGRALLVGPASSGFGPQDHEAWIYTPPSGEPEEVAPERPTVSTPESSVPGTGGLAAPEATVGTTPAPTISTVPPVKVSAAHASSVKHRSRRRHRRHHRHHRRHAGRAIRVRRG